MSNELIKKAYEDFNGVWPYPNYNGMVAFSGSESSAYYGRYTYINSKDDLLNDMWQWVGTKADFDAYGDSLKEEWMPEVGQECEFSCEGHHDGFEWCIFRGFLSDGGYIVEYHHVTSPSMVTCDCFDPLSTGFRPLKTEDEKQAEEMWDIVKDATDLFHACELLVKNGFKKCAG